MRPITVNVGPATASSTTAIAGAQTPLAGTLMLNGTPAGGAAAAGFSGVVAVNKGVLTITGLAWDANRMANDIGQLPDWIADFQNGHYWKAGVDSNLPSALIVPPGPGWTGTWDPANIIAGRGVQELAAGGSNNGMIAQTRATATYLVNLVSDGAPPINDPTFNRNTQWQFAQGVLDQAAPVLSGFQVQATPPAATNVSQGLQTSSLAPIGVATAAVMTQPRLRTAGMISPNNNNFMNAEGTGPTTYVQNTAPAPTYVGFRSLFPAGIGVTGHTYLALFAGYPNRPSAAAAAFLAPLSPVVPGAGPTTGAITPGMTLQGFGIAAPGLRVLGPGTVPGTWNVTPGTTFNSTQVYGNAVTTLDTPRQVTIVNTEQAPTQFTVVGTNASGQLISETLTANGGNLTTQQAFATVTSVSISANAANPVSVGTGPATSRWVLFDPYVDVASISKQATVTGAATFTVQTTNDDPNSPTNPVPPGSTNWANDTDPNFVNATANVFGYWSFVPTWARVLLTAGTGSVRATFVQVG